MSLLLLLSSSGGGTPSGTIAATAPAAEASLTGESASALNASIAASAPMPRAGIVGSSNVTYGDLSPGDPGYDPDADPTELVVPTGWQVRAVTPAGSVVNLLGGVNIGTLHRAINGDQYADLSIPTLHPDAEAFDLFTNEVQLWLDGAIKFWGRPARLDSSRESSTDTLTIRCDGLFSYFYDEVVGGVRPNHIVSPHEDAAAVGTLPNSWQATSSVEQHAVVDNNWEFSDAKKAIQVNNSVTLADAYIWQRFTVPAELAGIPFSAMAYAYISDSEAGSPPWGGPAFNERGLTIARLDGTTFSPVSGIKSAKITNDTPRNSLIRLQTKEVIPQAGEIIEVRLYAPDAWTAWRYVALRDGRWEGVDRKDKSLAVKELVDHAQDTTVGKQAHNIGTDLATIGEAITRQWPWWRRDNIGEQIVDLADTFEFTMAVTATTRTLKVRRKVGTVRTTTLTKRDFVGWGLGLELATAYSRVIRQGEGNGISRDEWYAVDSTSLRGAVREALTFAPPGETLALLRDNAEAHLDRVSNVTKLPRARIVGELATSLEPGDTLNVNIDHGWAQFNGQARALAIDLDGASRVATLHLEPV